MKPLESEAQVRGWAESLRGERISDSGRALIDAAEHAMHRVIDAEDTDAKARLLTTVDKLVRAAFQADKAKNDNTLQDLQRHRAEGDDLAKAFHAPLQ